MAAEEFGCAIWMKDNLVPRDIEDNIDAISTKQDLRKEFPR